jgi:hypothetical protein
MHRRSVLALLVALAALLLEPVSSAYSAPTSTTPSSNESFYVVSSHNMASASVTIQNSASGIAIPLNVNNRCSGQVLSDGQLERRKRTDRHFMERAN